jgi:dTDP-4-dehydrorhamnose reductase
VLVLGSGGFLGSNVARSIVSDGAEELFLHVRAKDPPFAPRGSQTVRADLTSPDLLEGVLAEVRPRLVINCAALADVDECDRDPDLADELNHRLPAQLAAWTARSGAGLVHVSTDAVFDGLGGPYTEFSEPSPVNAYGRSKLAGELAVARHDPRALIVRTNIVGWSPCGTRSLLEFFYGRLVRSLPAPGFTDIFFRPLPVQWFWPGCARFLAVGATGVVHITGPELLSKYEFGRRVARAFGLDPELVRPA